MLVKSIGLPLPELKQGPNGTHRGLFGQLLTVKTVAVSQSVVSQSFNHEKAHRKL